MMKKVLPMRFVLAVPTLLTSLLVISCDSGKPVDMVILPPTEPEKVILDVAGTQGVSGNGGDGGPALSCSLYRPIDVIVAPVGLLVVDRANHRIRRIRSDGVIEPFIGSGSVGDDETGHGPTVALNGPVAIDLGPDGSYYVSVFYNYRVKRFDATTLLCSVVAGIGSRGFAGDGDLATNANRDLPSSTVSDPTGGWYILDQGNSRIRKVDGTTGMISTFAGGTRGYLDGPCDSVRFALPGHHTAGASHEDRSAMVSTQRGDKILICDTENHRIRVLDLATCFVSTIAGVGLPGWEGDNGPALSAKLNFPTDIAIAANGDMYIADQHNQVIRKISSLGIITTVAGNGTIGMSPSGTRAVEAMLYEPSGVDFDDATNTSTSATPTIIRSAK
jgi:hypothetical protein